MYFLKTSRCLNETNGKSCSLTAELLSQTTCDADRRRPLFCGEIHLKCDFATALLHQYQTSACASLSEWQRQWVNVRVRRGRVRAIGHALAAAPAAMPRRFASGAACVRRDKPEPSCLGGRGWSRRTRRQLSPAANPAECLSYTRSYIHFLPRKPFSGSQAFSLLSISQFCLTLHVRLTDRRLSFLATTELAEMGKRCTQCESCRCLVRMSYGWHVWSMQAFQVWGHVPKGCSRI